VRYRCMLNAELYPKSSYRTARTNGSAIAQQMIFFTRCIIRLRGLIVWMLGKGVYAIRSGIHPSDWNFQ
jgi:hypothetical protein